MRGGYDDLEIVAMNDLVNISNLAYLLKFDSVHGRAGFDIQVEGENTLVLDGKKFSVFANPDPEKLPWGELGVNVVIEASSMVVSGSVSKC